MRKIRIMCMVTRLNVRGAWIHVVALTRGLDRDKFETVPITGQFGKGEGDMGYLAKEAGIWPVIMPTLGREINSADDIVLFVRIFQLILAERPDAIHIHLAKAGTLGRAAGVPAKIVLIFCSKKIKIFHTYYGHYFYGYFGPVKTRVFIYVERAFALICQQVIIISRRLKDDIVRTCRIIPENRTVVIPHGFDFDKLTTNGSGPKRFRREAGTGPCEKLVGIVGRLTAIKNHDLFLKEAARWLPDDTMPPLRFAAVGDGELKGSAGTEDRELGIAGRVTFTGCRPDMGEVYAGLDAPMLTSVNEGTPVTNIQAMAAEISVVAAGVGGIPDLPGGIRKGSRKPASGVSWSLPVTPRAASFRGFAEHFTRHRARQAEKK